jgi:hypothetical protein
MQLFPLSDPYPPPQRRGRKRRIRGAEIQNLPATEDASNESCDVVGLRNACALDNSVEIRGGNHEN